MDARGCRWLSNEPHRSEQERIARTYFEWLFLQKPQPRLIPGVMQAHGTTGAIHGEYAVAEISKYGEVYNRLGLRKGIER